MRNRELRLKELEAQKRKEELEAQQQKEELEAQQRKEELEAQQRKEELEGQQRKEELEAQQRKEELALKHEREMKALELPMSPLLLNLICVKMCDWYHLLMSRKSISTFSTLREWLNSKFEMAHRPVTFVAAKCFEGEGPRGIYSFADF